MLGHRVVEANELERILRMDLEIRTRADPTRRPEPRCCGLNRRASACGGSAWILAVADHAASLGALLGLPEAGPSP